MDYDYIYRVAILLGFLYLGWQVTVLYLTFLELVKIAKRYLTIKERLAGDYDKL